MNIKPILIVPGERNSIFYEILFKSIKRLQLKSPLILINSKKIFFDKMKKFHLKKNLN